MPEGNFTVGNVSGVGHAIGPNATSNVSIGQAQRNELKALIAELRQHVAEAPLPEPAKQVMLTRAVPALEQAPADPNPQQAVKSGLERLNDQLEAAGATGEKVVKIAGVVEKIATTVGLTVSAAAPFLARFFR